MGRQGGGRGERVTLPWKELSNVEREERRFATSERVGSGEKGETKQTSWETGHGGWLLKDREIGR